MKSTQEYSEEMFSGLDNNAITSLYNQLGAGAEQQLSELGLEPSYSQGQIDLTSQPSLGNLLAHANSMTFSYPSLNGPRRGTSAFFGRTLSSQSSGLGLAPTSEFEGMGSWSNVGVGDMEGQIPGAEYEAPLPPVSAGISQTFSTLVASEALQYPPEFMLENSRMDMADVELLSKASVAIQGLQEVEESCPGVLDNIKRQQSQAISNSDINAYRKIEAEQEKMATNLEKALQELFTLVRSTILDSYLLVSARSLSQQFMLHQQVLELYRQELQQTFGTGVPLAPNSIPPIVSLYLIEQPLPQVVFKEKPIEETYTVALLTASQQNIATDKMMTAVLMAPDVSKSGPNLTNHVVPIEGNVNDRKAKFNSLTVSVSSRMNHVNVRFQTSVERGTFHASITTIPSFPFIVITNESQWFEAAGKLLLLDTFGHPKPVTWPQFANTLHSHFLKATRQTDPERPLYHFEFDYIHRRFFNHSEHVVEKQVTAFWSWFGQCLQTIRFKRYISTLWNTGAIFGFITKEECNKVLQGQGLGTFIIRFSESLPGLFGVAYVSDDPKERIKHCLIKNEDIGSNKSLAEFLRDKDQFQLLLRMEPHEMGKIRRFPKDVVLQQYYSKKKVASVSSNPGYIVL